MTSYRYRVKDIKPGDTVLYKPVGQPMTDEFIRTQLLATGTVTEVRVGGMSLTVDWGEWEVPGVVDVNDVELVGRA